MGLPPLRAVDGNNVNATHARVTIAGEFLRDIVGVHCAAHPPPIGVRLGLRGHWWPGANYFIGTMTNWAFTNFVFGGTNITSLALATNVAQFEFSNGAGVGFTFQSGLPNTPPTLSSLANQILDAPFGGG